MRHCRAPHLTCDYNGNALTKTDTTGRTQYAWDFEKRLTSVTMPDTGNEPTVVTFKYVKITEGS